ncbi:MAG TPA: protein phosphatase 2C domain-containing protein [Bryobacteraceae bacterium]|jgi:protein phosphatase|nr:protein phosphatase 2C domain-containing protein [Bryobacteraceae bacterium]
MPSANHSLTVSVGVQSHPGSKRSENQDRVSRAATPFGDLYVLADGVGGQGGGGDAAQAAVAGFADYLRAHGGQPLAEALQNAAREISSGLRRRSDEAGLAQGMSSTVVLAVINKDRAIIAHAGDSRAYLVRDNRLRLLTRDDSLVERLISQGVLTPAQAREHPDSSVLTQALGQRSEVTLTITELALQPKDGLLLCSDGLWGYAAHAEMEAIALALNISVTGVAEALLNLALQGGGGDNISIQFLRFAAPWAVVRSPARWFGVRPRLAVPLGLAAGCMLAAGAGLTYWNLQHPLRIANPGMHDDGFSLLGSAAATAAGPPESKAADSSRTVGGRGAPPAPPLSHIRTKLILVAAGDAPPPDWTAKLGSLATVDIHHVKGAPGCLSLRQAKPVLLYVHRAVAPAREIAEKLRFESAAVIELSPQALAPCGDADLFLLPAQPSTASRQPDP